jgi:hypothetical protein
MVDLARRPRRERHVPDIAVLGLAARWLFPETCEQPILHAIRRWHFGPVPQPSTDENLYHAAERGGTTTGHRPPRLGALTFAARVIAELIRMQSGPSRGSLRRRVADAR